MNIFVTDENPFQAACNLCDAHVIKMIVESCQLLSTYDRLWGLKGDRYKITHKNHPCRQCLSNKNNYIWLQYHLYGLCKEYTFRFNKIHKSQLLLEKYWNRNDFEECFMINDIFFTKYSNIVYNTTFPQCMPIEFRNSNNKIYGVITAYKKYYKFKKANLKRWKYTKRNEPIWLN